VALSITETVLLLWFVTYPYGCANAAPVLTTANASPMRDLKQFVRIATSLLKGESLTHKKAGVTAGPSGDYASALPMRIE
jgi:hypothetical protein